MTKQIRYNLESIIIHIDMNRPQESEQRGTSETHAQAAEFEIASHASTSVPPALDAYSKVRDKLETGLMSIFVLVLTFSHLSTMWGFYLTIPYYVLSTPEYGWTVSELSFIFPCFLFGAIIATQISMVAECSHKMFFILHLMTFVAGTVGAVIMSSIFDLHFLNSEYDLYFFYFGAFLCGICGEDSTIQAYATLISDDEKIQKSLVARIGSMFIGTAIIDSFMLPAVYEMFGFRMFCGVLVAMDLMAVVIMCLLWSILFQKDQNRENIQNEQVSDSKESKLTLPMFMMLLIQMTSALFDLYLVAYPIAFAEDFGIGSTVGGYLYAASALFSFIVLSVLLTLSNNFGICPYPYDQVLLLTVYMIGNAFYVMFYAPWIAYTTHWVIAVLPSVMRGCERVSRLELCPPAEFNRLTSVGGMLKIVGYLSGSFAGPILFSIWKRLPFIVLFGISGLLMTMILTVYVHRKRFLSALSSSTDQSVTMTYLSAERNHYRARKGAVADKTRRQSKCD